MSLRHDDNQVSESRVSLQMFAFRNSLNLTYKTRNRVGYINIKIRLTSRVTPDAWRKGSHQR